MKIIKKKNYLLTINLSGKDIIISEHENLEDAIFAQKEAERKILKLLGEDLNTKIEDLKYSLVTWAKVATKPITSTEMMYMVTKNTNAWRGFRDVHLDSILQEIKEKFGITIVENPVKSGNTKSWIVTQKGTTFKN